MTRLQYNILLILLIVIIIELGEPSLMQFMWMIAGILVGSVIVSDIITDTLKSMSKKSVDCDHNFYWSKEKHRYVCQDCHIELTPEEALEEDG
jgi:hypothetical protein